MDVLGTGNKGRVPRPTGAIPLPRVFGGPVIVDFALLADHALGRKDGKLDITGGGVSHITAESVPSSVASLSLVVRLLLEGSDRGRDRSAQFRVSRGGTVLSESPIYPISGEATRHFNFAEGHRAAFVIIGELGHLSFTAYGPYTVEFLLDGDVVASKELAVIPPNSSSTERLFGSKDELT